MTAASRDFPASNLWQSGDHPDYDLFPEISKINSDRPDCSDRLDYDRTNSRLHPDCLFPNYRDLKADEDHRRPSVRFSGAEWRRMAEIDEGCTLVGRFAKERPSLELIRARIGEVLRLEGGVQIGSLNRRSITLRFVLESDFKRSWFQGHMLMDGARACFERWTPN